MVGTQKDHRVRGAILVAVVFLAVHSAQGSAAVTPTIVEPVPQWMFSPVVVPRSSPFLGETIVDPIQSKPPGPTGAPRRPQPQPQPEVVARSQRPAIGASFSATYYCLAGESRCMAGYPDGPGIDRYAAISPELLHWRGDQARVCYQGSCVTVTIIDCNCQATGAIDLYADAFRQLAPLSAGRITVTIERLN